jgi:hypothetical protein
MSAKSGPGQAPVKAHPNPKMVPPAAYCMPLPKGLAGIEILSPETDFNPTRLISANDRAAVATAEPMIPYIRKD